MTSYQSTIKQLELLRDELTHRIEAIDADVHHKKEPVEKDFAEQVTQRENDEVLMAIDEEAQQTVHLINAALTRIGDGSYGTCADCGQDIPEKRLAALPYVTTCINCAE
ncbi:MAG: TraR/DksA family transcriptional regulator [Gammaproteobacteria bacterium]|nr:TraR/DksA family transcriptional regulator [Gammaproteobacteria bacterium]